MHYSYVSGCEIYKFCLSQPETRKLFRFEDILAFYVDSFLLCLCIGLRNEMEYGHVTTSSVGLFCVLTKRCADAVWPVFQD